MLLQYFTKAKGEFIMTENKTLKIVVIRFLYPGKTLDDISFYWLDFRNLPADKWY